MQDFGFLVKYTSYSAGIIFTKGYYSIFSFFIRKYTSKKQKKFTNSCCRFGIVQVYLLIELKFALNYFSRSGNFLKFCSGHGPVIKYPATTMDKNGEPMFRGINILQANFTSPPQLKMIGHCSLMICIRTIARQACVLVCLS